MNEYVLGQTAGFAFETDANGNITEYSFYLNQSPDSDISVYYGGPGNTSQLYSSAVGYQAQFQGVGSIIGSWTQ